MPRHRLIVLAFVLALPFRVATARPPYVPLAERVAPAALADIGLTPQQVSALDALLEASERAAPARATVPADDGPAGPARHAGLDSAPISARVMGRVEGWAPDTLFELDNGQQWRVLKGRVSLRTPVDRPVVRLVPGIAGRWFLELDEDHPKARVYRVD